MIRFCKTGLLLFSGLLLFAAGAACDPPRERFRIGTNVWPGYEPLYLARELNLYPSESIQLVEFPSASEVIRNFRNGSIDGGALTMDEVCLLAQDGVQLKVILVLDVSHGGDVILGQPGLRRFADLKNKRVGVERSALGAFMLGRALEKNGFVAGDLEIVDLEENEHLGAFQRGEVDAVVTFEPVRTRILKLGGNILFDSSRIPGEIVDVLVVRQEFLNRHPEILQDLLTGWFAALEKLRDDSQAAAKIMAARQQITPAEFLASLGGLRIPDRAENLRLLGANPSLVPVIQTLQRIMVQNQILTRRTDPARLIDPTPLQEFVR